MSVAEQLEFERPVSRQVSAHGGRLAIAFESVELSAPATGKIARRQVTRLRMRFIASRTYHLEVEGLSTTTVSHIEWESLVLEALRQIL